MEAAPVEAGNHEGSMLGHNPLTNIVAITIAILATFMGICGIKSTNISQALQSNMADRIELMLENQSRVTRAEAATTAADRYRLESKNLPPDVRTAFTQRAADYENRSKAESKAQADAELQIRKDKRQYDTWQSQQAGFDLSEAALSLAIALLAITALIQRWWLYIVSLVPSLFGVIMGLAGFFNWSVGMQHLVKFLEA